MISKQSLSQKELTLASKFKWPAEFTSLQNQLFLLEKSSWISGQPVKTLQDGISRMDAATKALKEQHARRRRLAHSLNDSDDPRVPVDARATALVQLQREAVSEMQDLLYGAEMDLVNHTK